MHRILIPTLVLLSACADASIFRCHGAAGEPAFQDHPCIGESNTKIELRSGNRMDAGHMGWPTPLLDKLIRQQKQRAAASRRQLDQAAYRKRRNCDRARQAAKKEGIRPAVRVAIASRIVRNCF